MEDNRYVKHMNWHYCECEKKRYDDVDKHEQKEKPCCHKKDDCKQEHHHCPYKDMKHCSEEDKEERKDDHHQCQGCICHVLKRFEIGTTVDVYLSSGGSFLGVTFLKLDNRNCCAYFVECGVATAPIIIDCQKIDAIR